MRLRFKPSPAREWNDEQFYRFPDDQREGRGICKGFSVASRRTMLNRLNMVRKDASLPDFITLTFPDDVFCDSVTEFSKRAKVWLDTWLKRLKRVAPEAAGFWRMEWQSRKSGKHEGKLFPHFHLMMWGLPKREVGDGFEESYVDSPDHQLAFAGLSGRVFKEHVFDSRRAGEKFFNRSCRQASREHLSAPEMRCMSFFDWSSASWYHVVDSHNLDHFLAGVSVERVRSWGGVMSYCSKYMAKLGDANFLADIPLGRSWGIFNRASIPWGEMLEVPLSDEVGVRIRRVMRRYLQGVRGRRYSAPYGITFYGDVSQWSRLWEPPVDTPF